MEKIMEELIDMKDDIVDWLFYINLFSIVLGFFMFTKTLFIFVMSINIILCGTFMIMSKFGDKFTKQYNKNMEDDDGIISR